MPDVPNVPLDPDEVPNTQVVIPDMPADWTPAADPGPLDASEDFAALVDPTTGEIL